MPAPIGADEAAVLLEPLAVTGRVLLGVSGGPDSVALMHLASRAAVAGSWGLPVVATVDHGLQPRSGSVAQSVADQARRLGLDVHILNWIGRKPSSGVQNAAREARYALLAGLAETIGATHLVTAHTLDDQAETILFRMARGSGLAGLTGMQPAMRRGAIVHLRPLLGVEKRRLVATCRHESWSYVEDPANHDPRFARSRMRVLLPLLAAEGLDARTLANLAARLASSQEAILASAESLGRSTSLPSGPDRRLYDAAVLFGEPRAVVTACLNEALTGFGRPGPPRLGRLEALVGQLAAAVRDGRSIGRTLHGALIDLRGGTRLELTREGPRRRGNPVSGVSKIDDDD